MNLKNINIALWCNKIYDKFYLEQKENIYLETLEKLKKYAPVMDERDIFNFENYDGNNCENKKIIEILLLMNLI